MSLSNEEKNAAYEKLTPQRKQLVDKVMENLEKGNLFFFISQWKNLENRTTRIDTESSVLIEVEIDGHKGFYSEKEGRQSIYLNMGDISVNIYGNIGKKEIFKLAENLELLAR